MTIKEFCEHFNISGKYVRCSEVPTGNINCTYKVEYVNEGENKYYILQKINKSVFTEPERVMENIVRVTHHVRMNVIKKGLSTKRFVLRAFLSKETGLPFVVDDHDEYWRCYRFIKDAITYDTCDDLAIIERAGMAFGRFQDCLEGFDAASLYVSIPDFHNTPKRFATLHKAVEENVCNRVRKVQLELEELYKIEERACKLQKLLEDGKIPLRVTHNDTKCNNVSFDKNNGEALAVLDLDTVMPGAVAYDFGDAIRFIANTRIEDDPDVDAVKLDLEKYEAFTRGFITQIKDNLTDYEKNTMNLGVLAMTAELAVRFLTDYLNGDKYFKTKYPGHNLDRARNQLALTLDIIKKESEIDKILQKYI